MRTMLVDLWRARGLTLALARKDFFVQYRRASFGVAWALALPMLQAAVLAVIVPRLVAFQTPGAYVTFVFGGTIVWALFSSSVIAGAGSIVDAQHISTRVYFPRLVLPIVSVLARVYNFLPAAVLLLILTVLTGSASLRLLLLVPACLLATLLTVAVSAVLGALNVYFRDVRHLAQAALLGWFYLTPVIFPLSAVPGLRRWIEINPMTGVVEAFRGATVGADPTWLPSVLWTIAWISALAIISLLLYRRYDRVFVDLL